MTTTITQITYDEWVEKYKPISNPRIERRWGHEDIDFDTHDPEDVEALKQVPDNRIWTLGSGDGYDYISSGWHFVNRLAYHVTMVPFEGDVEVLIAREDDCDCYDPEEDDPNQDCDKCEGSGYIRTYYTREMIDQENKEEN